MDSEYTRQTRWGHLPEPIDPVRFPPGSVIVKQLLWVPCTDCDLQVHASRSHRMGAGITCPECGRALLAPLSRERQEEASARIRTEEEQARQQSVIEEVPCSA